MENATTISPLNLLTGIREIISDPNRWTKCYPATTVLGLEVNPDDPRAVRFCLVGAGRKLVPKWEWDETGPKMLNFELTEFTGKHHAQPWVWNDAPDRTHAEVLEFLDTRIAHYLKLAQTAPKN